MEFSFNVCYFVLRNKKIKKLIRVWLQCYEGGRDYFIVSCITNEKQVLRPLHEDFLHILKRATAVPAARRVLSGPQKHFV